MRTWKLGAGDPLHLCLSADARLNPVDYGNDVTWEINLGQGEPPALSVQTTFGLRARWMQFFPVFTRAGVTVVDPAAFSRAPQVTRFFPNYAEINFAPFEGIEVRAEYRVATSQALAGRLRLTNKSVLPHNLRLDWACLLSPLGFGEGMAALPMGLGTALQGRTDGISVVCFLSGGPQPGKGAYPGLSLHLELYPGASTEILWAAACHEHEEGAFEEAQAAAGRPWEAELARIEIRAAADFYDVTTGDAALDAAFAFGQTAAARLLMSRPERLPEPSFILSRRIDQGTSVREDGADHSYLWAGQTALESWHLASALPGMPGLTEGLVRNFLATGDDDLPDFRPGLGGQRTHLLCQPLLASLVVRHASPAFYAEAYPALLRLFQAWMSEERDPDGDALPTWQHPIQTGLESIPTYDRWHAQAQGLNIQYLETPTLGALLYREARSLTEMAGSLERADDIPWLEAQAARIQAAVERMWDRRERIYRYRDAVTHTSRAGKEILAFNGSGEYPLKRKPNHPSRLVVQVTAREESTRAAILHITGVDENDAPLEEHLQPRDFTWSSTSGRATTRNVFRQVTRVEVNGLMEGDAGHILAADHSGEDLSLFLPLWAGIPDAARAKIILERNLLPRYAGPFGLPICPPDDCPEEPRELHCAALPWNALIADGLITAGYRREAADLILRMLNAVIAELRQGHTFRQFYDVNSGAGVGERGHLWGLPPLGLFLRAAGLDRISPTEVLVRGFNPFPWPITVKYQRMTVTRDGDIASIVLPGRPPVTVSGLQPQRISLT